MHRALQCVTQYIILYINIIIHTTDRHSVFFFSSSFSFDFLCEFSHDARATGTIAGANYCSRAQVLSRAAQCVDSYTRAFGFPSRVVVTTINNKKKIIGGGCCTRRLYRVAQRRRPRVPPRQPNYYYIGFVFSPRVHCAAPRLSCERKKTRYNNNGRRARIVFVCDDGAALLLRASSSSAECFVYHNILL